MESLDFIDVWTEDGKENVSIGVGTKLCVEFKFDIPGDLYSQLIGLKPVFEPEVFPKKSWDSTQISD